jgi:glycosyltransferase involved in cell wall biosynthesis
LVSAVRPRLAFVSPVFLLPADTGGRIRTSNLLRGLKGGAFEVSLISPASDAMRRQWSDRIETLCDHFVAWTPARERARWQRAIDLLGALPVNVQADRTAVAQRAVRQALATNEFDVAVFDFVHAAVLRPLQLECATVCLTHNVEAEIFERHAERAGNVLMRVVWSAQAAKMRRFERMVLPGFTSVVAVSDRDAAALRERCGIDSPDVIPTGVDLDYFSWKPRAAAAPGVAPTVAFTGSMDWAANIEGVGWFIREVWPRVLAAIPTARFVVVGRSPPAALLEESRSVPGVEFTGFVDDVRPHVRESDVFVIPLRVGGGTRIKAFEAMAMGCPVVSTAIGMEGLAVAPGEHFLLRDDAAGFAGAVIALLGDAASCHALATRARAVVEARFGHRAAARVFERACLGALDRWRAGSTQADGVAGVAL